MKRLFLSVLCLVGILFPLQTKALSITTASLSTAEEQTVGNYFNVSVNVNFAGLNKNNVSSDGVYMVLCELEFDNSALEITNASSSGYDTGVLTSDGKYYILSEVNSTINTCADDFLVCSDYKATLQFFVKNTQKESVTLKLTEVEVVGYKVDVEAEYYENPITTSIVSNTVRTIRLSQTDKKVVEPNSIAKNSTPKINTTTAPKTKSNTSSNNKSSKESPSKTEEESTTSKSTNKNLKSLSIKGYDINFKKDKYVYKITVPKKVTEVEVIAKPEDEKATYTIIGANNLKKDKNTIKIIVTAENQEKLTYFVEVMKDTEKSENTDSITNKLNKVVIIVVIIVVLISLIAGIVYYHNKRKLKKMIDNS